MSAHDDGGPAFPSAPTVGPSGDLYRPADIGCPGLSIRDYFIAHAPAEPQQWFRPTMPPCPVPHLVGHDGRTYATTLDAERACGEDGFEDRNYEAINDWQRECAKQRYVQWPAAWADAMLKVRRA